MPFRINHIHIKAPDPRKTAEWWVRAFAFKIISDETRVFGDRFVRCLTEDGGVTVSISNARTGETLGPGNATAHFGLEHFAIETDGHRCRHRPPSGARRPPPGRADSSAQRRSLRVPGAPDEVRIELVQLPKASP